MYPDRTYMYVAFSLVVIEKSYFQAGTQTCQGNETRDGGAEPNHPVPGDGGLELSSRVPRRVENIDFGMNTEANK
jgi:hypothetical protein